MIETAAQKAGRPQTARELLRFLGRVMPALAEVDLGAPGVGELTLVEMRILIALGESQDALALRDLAGLTGTSAGYCGQAADGLCSRGLAERVRGGRGPDRAIRISPHGRRLLASLEVKRQAALESFIDGLGPSEQLRLDGAAHLLGDLGRLSRGMLAA